MEPNAEDALGARTSGQYPSHPQVDRLSRYGARSFHIHLLAWNHQNGEEAQALPCHEAEPDRFSVF